MSDETLPHGAFREGLVALNVDTGSSRLVTRFPLDAGGSDWLWAVDLVASPTAPGIEPPHPWDPRVTTGGIALIVGAATWLVWLRRRRRGRP